MFKHLKPALVALALAFPASAQEIQPPEGGSDLFESLGTFLREGLSAPRTAADLAREEDKARAAAAKPAAEPAPEPPPEAPPIVVPVAAPAVEPAPPAPPPPVPVIAAPVIVAAPIVAPPAPAVAPPPAPRPAKPVAIVVPPSPPAEPITDRIAGTATLDQAIKLGGPVELYGRRRGRPAGN